VIFVSTGTNEQPFDRLVRAAAALGGDEPLLVQHGSSQVPHGRGDWRAFLTFEEMSEAMRTARAVVVHAGVGSVLLARRCGRTPIVVPRRVALGEAVDDHQVAFARRLADAGLVILVEEERELPAALDQIGPASAGVNRDGTPGRLAYEVGRYLAGMVAA
jgi:UDP-N-acetylglucosamine transferase subunit ALG13